MMSRRISVIDAGLGMLLLLATAELLICIPASADWRNVPDPGQGKCVSGCGGGGSSGGSSGYSGGYSAPRHDWEGDRAREREKEFNEAVAGERASVRQRSYQLEQKANADAAERRQFEQRELLQKSREDFERSKMDGISRLKMPSKNSLAGDQVRSADYHGGLAIGSDPETAKRETTKIFDLQEGTYVGSLPQVDLHGVGPRPAMPTWMTQTKGYALLDAKMTDLEGQHQKIHIELEQVEGQRIRGGENKNDSVMEQVRLKQNLSLIENKMAKVHQEMVDLRVNLEGAGSTEQK